jgi:hypothetical protein
VGPPDPHPDCVPTHQVLPGPSSMWDHWIHTPPVPIPLWPHQAPVLQVFCMVTPPGSCMAGHHMNAPNLLKRHRQTGQDAKGVT